MTNRALIETVLKGIAHDIAQDMSAKNLTASGKSARSLKPVILDDNEGQLKGAAHIYFQIHGRQPGPFKDGIKTMLKWIKDKGIQPNDSKTSLKSLAYLFARKISQRGNDIYLRKRKGLETKEIYSKWKKILVEMFKENLKKEIHAVTAK